MNRKISAEGLDFFAFEDIFPSLNRIATDSWGKPLGGPQLFSRRNPVRKAGRKSRKRPIDLREAGN
jgi:hypothetical protein